MTRPLKIPVIIGPTAGGKTTLAVRVAQRFADQLGCPGEVISADSVQIYTGMDIGSAKPTIGERKGIPHHLIDIVKPNESFTVYDWLTHAEATIKAIRARQQAPIVAGGTHLYIKALLDGLFEGPDPDPDLRAALLAEPLDQLRSRLESVDPAASQRIHPNDRRRTVRALEVFGLTGTPISDLQRQWDADRPRRDDLIVFALRWPTEVINARINQRVREMIASGLVEEVRQLLPGLGLQAREALGYKQIRASINDRMPLEHAIERIKIETRRFAKNQRTWLKRMALDPRFQWLDMGQNSLDEASQTIVNKCLMAS